MPAYIAAVQRGTHYVDMDIAMTADNQIVITHDLKLNPNLTRNASGQWIDGSTAPVVKNLTLAQLQTYDVGRLKPGTRYASFFPHQQSIDHTPISTLRNVIRKVKEMSADKVGFQIEIKTDPEHPELAPSPAEFAAALHGLLQEEGIIDRTEVQAFDWRCLIELKKLNPDIKTAFLSDHTTILSGPKEGLWTAGHKLSDHGNSLPQMVKDLGGDCWEPFEMNLTKEMVDEAHALGLKVVPWGWPEEEGGLEFNRGQIMKLIEWGVDGIIADRPDLLAQVLTETGKGMPLDP